MDEIDIKLQQMSDTICKNIENIQVLSRGVVSQNILATARTLVEHIAMKAYSQENELSIEYDCVKNAMEYIKQDNKYLFLRRFHSFLQESKSHYYCSNDNAERLFLKYYNYFMLIKNFVKDEYNLTLLENLETYPLNTDKTIQEYYDKIAGILEKGIPFLDLNSNQRFYVKKIKSFNSNGVYGINNINRFLQNNNENTAYKQGVWTYKINDPILFNENNRFAPVLYNNLKGKIIQIEQKEGGLLFSVEIDKAINEWDADDVGLELLESKEKGKSVVRFWVSDPVNTDEDIQKEESITPFQVAYAVSIHKAQGLEYNSVKIVITEEVDEQITHNIFYTAITRSKDKLKIYWTPESQQKILDSLEKVDVSNDATIFAGQTGIKKVK